jgi:hypothetical protein
MKSKSREDAKSAKTAAKEGKIRIPKPEWRINDRNQNHERKDEARRESHRGRAVLVFIRPFDIRI